MNMFWICSRGGIQESFSNDIISVKKKIKKKKQIKKSEFQLMSSNQACACGASMQLLDVKSSFALVFPIKKSLRNWTTNDPGCGASSAFYFAYFRP